MDLPAHLESINCEFIGIDDQLFMIKVNLVHFSDFPPATLYLLQSLLDKDIVAQAALDTLEISDDEDRLQKFALCQFGGFDNLPDVEGNNEAVNHEFYACGLRGQCPVEGKLCHHIQADHGFITPAEIKVIRLIAEDLADKEIADKLGITYNTAATHRRNITKKIGCNSKVGICKFAIQKRII